jgi:DNA-binding NarL/FixJ family response regulator
MIPVALIQDNRVAREGLAAQINQTADVRAVGTASSGATALLARDGPRVILLHVGLGRTDCLRIADESRRARPDAQVVVMDLSPGHDDLMEFVNAGVAGFVPKDASFDDLLTTIRAVAEGEKVLPPDMATALFAQIVHEGVGRRGRLALTDVRLTEREREVVKLISSGSSNKEIASALMIATHTVKSHVRNVMEKLALHTRLQIAAYSNDAGPEAPLLARTCEAPSLARVMVSASRRA